MAQRAYYLAGPMSGHPGFNYPAFTEAAQKLRSKGLRVLSAHEVVRPDDGAPGSIPWKEYLRRDLQVMLNCDAIVLLPGWESSKGANVEYDLARKLEYPAFRYVTSIHFPMYLEPMS